MSQETIKFIETPSSDDEDAVDSKKKSKKSGESANKPQEQDKSKEPVVIAEGSLWERVINRSQDQPKTKEPEAAKSPAEESGLLPAESDNEIEKLEAET